MGIRHIHNHMLNPGIGQGAAQTDSMWLSHTTVVLQEAFHTYQGFFKLIIGGAVGAAHIAITAMAEGATWNDSLPFPRRAFSRQIPRHSYL